MARELRFPFAPFMILAGILPTLVCTPAMADSLTGNQIQRIIIGHTWAWSSHKFDSRGSTTYFRDGRIFMTVDGRDHPERGRWRIDGDKLCITLVGNSEACSSEIIRIEETIYFSKSSQTTFELRE